MARVLPVLVNKLTYLHEGWVIGSAALASTDLANVRDYDILISFAHWREAAALVPADARPNSFGGWKCSTPEGAIVDVWPGDIGWVMTNAMCTAAWHPRTGARWLRQDL
jgi:hypothetical protein